NEELFARARKLIPGGVNSPVRAFGAVGGTPVFFARAAGAHLWDVEGKRYVDYVGSWGPMVAGHSHPAVVAAVQAAAASALSFGNPSSAGVPAEVVAHTAVLSYNDTVGVKKFFSQNGKTVAAVIVEPVAGNMNLVLPADGFLEALREECTRHGALLILDEV